MTNLDLYVARAKLPIAVDYVPTPVGPSNERWYVYEKDAEYVSYGDTAARATRAYTALRDRLMAERGQITDRVV